MNITDFIPVGRANALSMRDLALAVNVDERTARELVHRARANGEPICSDCDENGGYYMPRTVGEARIYLHQQEARIRSANAALRGVRKYIQENGGANNG